MGGGSSHVGITFIHLILGLLVPWVLVGIQRRLWFISAFLILITISWAHGSFPLKSFWFLGNQSWSKDIVRKVMKWWLVSMDTYWFRGKKSSWKQSVLTLHCEEPIYSYLRLDGRANVPSFCLCISLSSLHLDFLGLLGGLEISIPAIGSTSALGIFVYVHVGHIFFNWRYLYDV